VLIRSAGIYGNLPTAESAFWLRTPSALHHTDATAVPGSFRNELTSSLAAATLGVQSARTCRRETLTGSLRAVASGVGRVCRMPPESTTCPACRVGRAG
jgi:hypothetical protein